MRLLLDEHLDPAIARHLRDRGHDVVSVTELAELVGLSDRALFAWAIGSARVVVSYDAADFGPLAEELQSVGDPFPGVVLLSPRRYPQGPRALGRLVRDLGALIEALPATDLTGRTVWLAGGMGRG